MDIGKCIDELLNMTGHVPTVEGEMDLSDSDLAPTVLPTLIITGPAQFIVDIDDASVDCIVFDPPYHNNVNYAELSDFFYVWLKRTAGYVFPEYFIEYLTDKTNEAIASPARFRAQAAAAKAADRKSKVSASKLATADYLAKMREIFDECRRVIKPAEDGGIMTVMFTHKDLSAWDALITASDRIRVQHHARMANKDGSGVQPAHQGQSGCPLHDAHRLPALARRVHREQPSAPLARGRG